MKALAGIASLSIERDGIALPSAQARSLREVLVQERLSVPALCELVFDGAGQPTAAWTPGNALRVLVNGQYDPLFSGEVTAVEHVYGPASDAQIRVRGYDLLHRLRKRQPVRVHVQVTVADLARELSADLGVSVDAQERGPLWQRLMQYRQSDLDLLVDAAERAGLFLTLRNGVLHIVTLEGIGDPVELTLGDNLFEAKVEMNGDPACRSVQVMGWNPLTSEAHEGRAISGRVGRQIGVEVPPSRVGGTGERTVADQAIPDDRHADAMAQAELDLRLAREVTLWGAAEGDARLHPGCRAAVSGMATAISGQYVLTEVTHTIDGDSGFVSQFSSAPPAPRVRSRATSTALGTVTRVDDPDNLGRVRVTLASYGGAETEWMGVLTPGGGGKKGFVTMPDVGDEVLVLFAQEDPAQGVVLGGLYGKNGPPDSGVESGAVKRYTLLTPGGQRIRLDDNKNCVRIEDSTGSYIEMTPDGVTVHSEVDLKIEAPGKNLLIQAQKIDFKRA